MEINETNKINEELTRNRVHKEMLDCELDKFKTQFANELKYHIGKTINVNSIQTISFPKKKPLKVKIIDFINRLKYTFGFKS